MRTLRRLRHAPIHHTHENPRKQADEKVEHGRIRQQHQDGVGIGQIRVAQHRVKDHAGKRHRHDELREQGVEGVVHQVEFARQRAKQHHGKQNEHLQSSVCENFHKQPLM